jgi:Protein of unknown function (DUF3592)
MIGPLSRPYPPVENPTAMVTKAEPLRPTNVVQRNADVSDTALRMLYLQGGKSLAVPGVCLLGGLLLVFVVWPFAGGDKRVTAGVTASAKITDKGRRSESQRDENGDLQFSYWLRYSYQDGEGRSHESRVTLPYLDWNPLQKGDVLTIAYRPDHPEESQLIEKPSVGWRWAKRLTFMAGLPLCFVGGVVGARAWKTAGRRAWRVRSGQPVLAKVSRREEDPWAWLTRQPRCRLHYHFADSEGAQHAGTTCWLPHEIAYNWTHGDAMLVLVGADGKQHEADVFEVRRAELDALVSASADPGR